MGGLISDLCGDPSYHWAFIVGPKKETERTTPASKRYRAINTKLSNYTAPWRYEVVNLRRPVTSLLLVRITIAKVVDQVLLERTLQNIPVAQRPRFTCRTWVSAAIATLAKDGSLGRVRQCIGIRFKGGISSMWLKRRQLAGGRMVESGRWGCRLLIA